MEKLNELVEMSKVCHVIGTPVRLSDSQVDAIVEAFRELERELLQVREQRNQLLRDMGDMAAELTRMAESLEMVLKMRETL